MHVAVVIIIISSSSSSIDTIPQPLGGVGSRVVKSLDCGGKRSRVQIPVLPKVLGSDGTIYNYLPF